jgi:integrase
MAILAECPYCHRKQTLRNKKCKCGADLDQLKRTQKVRYWIDYLSDEGKKRRTPEGYSLEDAKAADGKVKGKKREGTILELTNEARTTFSDLIDWYLSRGDVKRLRSLERIEDSLENFRAVFGKRFINTVKPDDLSDYQIKREDAGKTAATIDMELSIAKTMINRAFDNDLVSGKTLKTFRSIKRRLTKGSNARERTMSVKEYLALLEAAQPHLKGILILAYNTGMRKGEILHLKLGHIDSKKGFIRLKKEDTKEKKPKNIPINAHVQKVLTEIPRALHHDYVFTYRGKPIAMGLRKSMRAACDAIGIKYGMNIDDGIRFHDIRTTVKTNMLRAGVDKAVRDVILGHSLQGMDKYYLQPKDDDLKTAMKKYTLWLDREIKKAKVDHSVDQTPGKKNKT